MLFRAMNALVDQMPEDPDAVWSMFDDPDYELQVEEVARCCRTRLALDAAKAAVGMPPDRRL